MIAILPINLLDLIDPKKCFTLIRQLRWPETIICPKCGSHHVVKRGFDDTQSARQRYQCKDCQARFDDLTDTIFAGHHQPLGVWILCLYLMGLNLSNQQIAQELELNKDDSQQMTSQLRSSIVEKKPEVILEQEVERDEVYVVAGFKGEPIKVAQKQRQGRRRRLKGKSGRGTLAQEKPPIFGMIQRSGEVLIKMLENVKQVTIKPLIQKAVALGTLVYTDEYAIYHRLGQWGYEHKTVCHGSGEYARDEDGDGFHEVHANSIEGFWSLLRSWLRPHRGISQDKLPFYLGFFEFVHNSRKRGKALLPSFLECLLA